MRSFACESPTWGGVVPDEKNVSQLGQLMVEDSELAAVELDAVAGTLRVSLSEAMKLPAPAEGAPATYADVDLIASEVDRFTVFPIASPNSVLEVAVTRVGEALSVARLFEAPAEHVDDVAIRIAPRGGIMFGAGVLRACADREHLRSGRAEKPIPVLPESRTVPRLNLYDMRLMGRLRLLSLSMKFTPGADRVVWVFEQRMSDTTAPRYVELRGIGLTSLQIYRFRRPPYDLLEVSVYGQDDERVDLAEIPPHGLGPTTVAIRVEPLAYAEWQPQRLSVRVVADISELVF